jgi:valyl-tRNA synthetase
MELSKNYIPATVEQKWYTHWIKQGYFNSYPDDRQPFTIVIPPPNVTGVLHMGHTLNETVQDILIRRARMSGYNACWVPGSDHASIATEARVVGMLKEQGIEKSQLTREEFLKYAYEWKEKYGGIIYHQIERLGCSVDWNRKAFTMDPEYYRAVMRVFVDLFDKQLIYRGARMINWDPSAKTALSDEEVEYREISGRLYYVKYQIADESGNPLEDLKLPGGTLVVATQRPETIMGDVAVCLNPGDERYLHLKGKQAIIPLVNRRVPIIFDSYVDPAFGTGVLKITPAHDINDYNIGLKNNLPIIDTLNEDGTLSRAAEIFIGMDRFEARKRVIERLKSEDLLVNEEEYPSRQGFSQRTQVPVEPRISTQWFVRMGRLAGPALKEVLDGRIRIHPEGKFLATYTYWLENVKDWCISRQLWWGQRIPAWFSPDGDFKVAETREEAFRKFKEQGLPGSESLKIEELNQDEDVLDTWFSSWLWPIEVFKGITHPGNGDIKYYYPSTVLVTGQDIIFFWVARMIMAGMEYMEERPFSDVYFTGMVRDKMGRKMSKSLGNSPDLLKLIDNYGADAVRFGILISAPAGNDLLFDESSLEQGKYFNNKLWNALKLIQGWGLRIEPEGPGEGQWGSEISFALSWFENRLSQARAILEKQFREFRLSEALKTLYSLIWDDFCSWYLEWVKPGIGKTIRLREFQQTVGYFEQLLQLLHPFMPFITEEIYHLLRAQPIDLCVKPFQEVRDFDESQVAKGEDLKLLITEIRDFRQENKIKGSEPIKSLELPKSLFGTDAHLLTILKKQLHIEKIIHPGEGPLDLEAQNHPSTITLLPFKTFQIRIQTTKEIDGGRRKEELLKEIGHLRGFLDSVNKKLNNDRFVKNAKPEVLALEQKKKKDAETKIQALEESLSAVK